MKESLITAIWAYIGAVILWIVVLYAPVKVDKFPEAYVVLATSANAMLIVGGICHILSKFEER